MQAMACALPVISTPVGSIGEIVEHEVTGLLVAPRDAGALQLALARLAADPALHETLGEAVHRFAPAQFATEIMPERMESALCSLGTCSPT